jgi:hypothetical protein
MVERIRRAAKAALGDETFLFMAYALIVFRPGATPPFFPMGNATQPRPIPDNWTDAEMIAFIEEGRIDAAAQQADKRDIRARAQIILTTAIVLGGTWVKSFSSSEDLCACETVLYVVAGLFIGLTMLAAGGIITARSDVGAVSVSALTHYETGEVLHTVATGYAVTRLVGSQTIAALVTVLRDCVVTLIVGAGLLALAHLLR